MKIEDFLIDPAGKDWGKLLGYWIPPLPADFTLWLVNRLGEPIFSASDGGIYRLTVGSGTIERLASDRRSFANSLDVTSNADAWLRIRLVSECRNLGMHLTTEECYGFKVPPQLFGKYETANLQPTNIYSHYSWLSHLAKQDAIYWTGD